jgi:hypothetical protein
MNTAVRLLAPAAISLVALIGHPGAAGAQSASHVMTRPADLKWTSMPTLPPGAMVAVIEGPIDQPVPFTVRFRLPANYEIPAHWHPVIEHVTVMSGTLHVGTGAKLDRSKTTPLTAGSVAVVPAQVNMFAWTAEETIVQVHGIGPFAISYVNPADDPRRAKQALLVVCADQRRLAARPFRVSVR